MKRGAEFWAKLQNAKGGLLGRPIELLIEDTAGDPATCVRKAQEMVERDGCRLLTGITLSSEALAVVPKLAEWDTIFISSDNGDGRLTAEILRAELLPRQHLGPDGHARGVALAAQSQAAELLCARARLRLGPQQHRRVRGRGEEGQEGLRRQGLLADRHQGLLDLHHQDPPVRRRRLLPRACRATTTTPSCRRRANTGCPTRCSC